MTSEIVQDASEEVKNKEENNLKFIRKEGLERGLRRRMKRRFNRGNRGRRGRQTFSALTKQ